MIKVSAIIYKLPELVQKDALLIYTFTKMPQFSFPKSI